MKWRLIVIAAVALIGCEETPSGEYISRACGGSGDFEVQERLRACDFMLTLYDEGSPGYASVLTTRARTKERSGDALGALADYDASLAIMPDLPGALLGRGRILLEAGDFDAAETTLHRSIEVHDSVIARDLLGAEAVRRGDYPAAFEYYNAVLEREGTDPMDAIGLYGRGVARLRMGDEAGRADIERAEQMSRTIRTHFEERGIRP